jgi:putative protease
MRKPELLAPAGDLNRCRIALAYGADAVYLGGQSFSLRSRASNFSMAEIIQACREAEEHHAAIHVTVNEIPHDEDFTGLEDYLRQLQEAGVKAVIAASPAVMALAKKTAPQLQVHCSTQMSVTNAAAAQYLQERLGIDRVVLARECTLAQIRDIVKACPVDTEAFIHGGMCVNYSGRCTLSNRMTLRDANRGGCAQSCRWQYHLYEQDQEITDPAVRFTMGSKDLMAADFLYDLMDAGVASLKIEGRMKTEYYVASIVSAYRHLIDEIWQAQAPLSEERMAWHREEILKGENRMTCSGFCGGQAGAESIIYRPNSNSDVSHDFAGVVLAYDESAKTALIQNRNPFAVGDELEILGRKENHRFRIAWMKNEEGEYLETANRPMAAVRMPVPCAVRALDIVRRTGK